MWVITTEIGPIEVRILKRYKLSRGREKEPVLAMVHCSQVGCDIRQLGIRRPIRWHDSVLLPTARCRARVARAVSKSQTNSINNLGAAAPIFFADQRQEPGTRHPRSQADKIYIMPEAASPRGRRHCEQNIYKTHKAASLAGRKLGSKQMPGTKKNVQMPSKIC
jgi:hypothetical protein